MNRMSSRVGHLSLGLTLLLGAALSPGCGSSSGKKQTDGGRDTGADTTGDTQAPDSGHDGDADGALDGAADASDADASVDSDASGDSAGDSSASDASTGDASASDGTIEVTPPFDAGIGCLAPPATETPLVPATEGVPAQGLVLWLRGDRGVYMTPGAGAVCAWADQSGHGVIVQQVTNRPIWLTGAVGDKPGIHFTASSDLATSSLLGIAPTSGRTFVAVVKLVSTTNRFQAVIQGKAGTPGTYVAPDTNTFNTAGSREGVYMTNNAYDSALATSTAARVHVYTVSTMTAGTPVLSAIDYRVNGAAQALTRNGGGLGNGNIESFADANFTSVGAGSSADANVAELLVYDHALTTNEKTAVETALKTRYGIQ
jgi:hypothetical protein